MEMKPLPPKSLDVFCDIFDFVQGQADITCPATDFRVSCLAALERRGLIVFDTERVHGKNKRWAALTELGAHYGCESLALAQVPEGLAPARNRVWVKIQFDLNNADYQKAYAIVGELARTRKLAPTVRDLLLNGIPDSKETRQFEDMFQAMGAMQQTMVELVTENRMLREQLQNTPQSSANPVNNGLKPVQSSTQGNAPKVLNVGQIQAPTFDDEDLDEGLLEVKVDSGAAMRSTQNFLRSMTALQDSKPTTDSRALSPRQRANLDKE